MTPPGFDAAAVADHGLELRKGIERLEGGLRELHAGDGAGLARGDDGGERACRPATVACGGDVAGAAEILGQRSARPFRRRSGRCSSAQARRSSGGSGLPLPGARRSAACVCRILDVVEREEGALRQAPDWLREVVRGMGAAAFLARAGRPRR